MTCPYCQHPLPESHFAGFLDGLEVGPVAASRDCPKCGARWEIYAKLIHGPKITPAELERVMNRPSGGRVMVEAIAEVVQKGQLLLEPLFFTVKQLASRYGVSTWTVRMWIWKGLLPARLLGGSIRGHRDDLRAFEETRWTPELCVLTTARPRTRSGQKRRKL